MIWARGASLLLWIALASGGLLRGQDPERYRAQVEALAQKDAENPPAKGGILFVGSSIFRLWSTLGEQMAPLPVINRAFGGSQTRDQLFHFDKVVLPYAPQIVVYYCGSNDVNAGRDAAGIFANFRTFAERVRAALPEARVYFVAINRAPDKEKRWRVVDEANALAREYSERTAKMGFIDVNPALFDAEGKPRMELYLPDRLHFKAPAYVEFTAIIKPVLERAWAQR